MDPNACLTELIDYMHADDWQGAYDRAIDLLDWLKRGGFTPDPAPGGMRSHLDEFALALHTSADEWDGDADLGESVSITRLSADERVIWLALMWATYGKAEVAEVPTWLTVHLDNRGFVWRETHMLEDVARAAYDRDASTYVDV